ncbi:hypothetical protein N7468_002845 [Penicillium chermesinum]|uniref:Tetratricopeptide repeat protein 36 n=1 Tax=Penicillium chermesinum TaxID=63820 RepID=A0A9W9PKQ8_9EURO|nr:uncharacterized protein N7468_002845 [Penicillium chermesinum]KAJ5247862.1 hypothetical protein N7468_002845 [Penicillium chermesinum]
MSVATARPSLSSNDTSVLQALFDAESAPSSGVKIDSQLPPWPATLNISPADLDSLKAQETQIVRKLHSNESPQREHVESALHSLDGLLNDYPSYPSAYANRAQVLRILVDLQSDRTNSHSPETIPRDDLFRLESAELCDRILSDIGKAISLATPASPADPVSPTQARLLADAHTHRGYLLLKAARTKKTAGGVGFGAGLPSRLCNLNADQLEEMASRDFFFGGRYGNKVAQQLSVQTNPYAKMCGAIMKEAMMKEMRG